MSQVTPRVLSTLADPARLAIFAELMSANTTDATAKDYTRERERLAAAGLSAAHASIEDIARTFERALIEVQMSNDVRHRTITRSIAPASLPFANGRLIELPRKPSQLDQLLDWLADVYLEKVVYTEAELGQELTRVHDDPATLRRALVDTGRFTRDSHTGTYRKSIRI